MNSDSDDDESSGHGGGGSGGGGFGIDLTGILFGNISSDGKLVNDHVSNAFDTEFRDHLSTLAKQGLNSMLNEIIDTEKDDNDRDADIDAKLPKQPMSDFDALKAGVTDVNEADNEDDDFTIKDKNAVGYSDIAQLSEDCPHTPCSFELQAIEDLKDGIPVSNKEASGFTKEETDLMQPPIPSVRSLSTSSNNAGAAPNVTPSDSSTNVEESERKLDTPLADMLPSKYANVDARELFPYFRPNKPPRFSRLFGAGQPSSLPKIWSSVKKRRHSRKHSREFKIPNTGFALHFGPDPTPDQCMSDDEDKLLCISNNEDINGETSEKKPKIADWRYGPAQMWYDMLNVPDSGEGFNYGFKTVPTSSGQKGHHFEGQAVVPIENDIEIKAKPIADDSYLLMAQLYWEVEMVWDRSEINTEFLQNLNSKTNTAGWLPSGLKANQAIQNKPEGAVDNTWNSIFPVENEELIYSKWEDEIILDPERMTRIPKPRVLILDPNDENLILGIPNDIDPSKIDNNTTPRPKTKMPHPHVKKSKLLLGKAGVLNVLAEDTPQPRPKSPGRDPFNISNDSYYMPKTAQTLRLKVGGGNLIQHSTPVAELRSPFIPTYMGPMKLSAFHRPPLKKFSHGPLAMPGPHPVMPLLKYIAEKAKQRELERIASGGGDVFFMRNPEDLSGKDGDIILSEFCEEHPPLMNQVGMCSKIKNYYKRKSAKDIGPQDFKYGEVAFAHTSPFLGIIHAGQCIQALENNMYRAPIYPHNINQNEFLVIRNRTNYWIREINAMFTVGQECPLYEVPVPKSKWSYNFTRDFLQVFIYRLFWKSSHNPRRIRTEDVKRAFPAHSDSTIRKRLKRCADFQRTGIHANWWVIKPEFCLPSEEEIRAMVSPEQCCAYFSMIAAQQRLKGAGYGEKFLSAPQEGDNEEAQLKLDDEVKVAPWNTTGAYIQAKHGKCLLQLTGPADPTGCGEGFSYVRVPNKPTVRKLYLQEQESQSKRTVTGTDADLRRLPLKRAKELLRKFKVPEEEIRKLSRWEVIDVVRTLYTEKAKAGEQGMSKFSRGNRFSAAEHQERYKEECQRIFDLQNRVLASSEVLSTDEDESSASEDSDLEEMGKNLENMLSNKKTYTQLSLEREEQERQELLKKIMEEQKGGSKGGKNKDGKDDNSQQPPSNANQGRILKITRTFKDANGKEYKRVEIVRQQPVIDAYIKIRTTKDEQFIRQFAALDEPKKKEMKREKRLIQEQLRRIKRNQERERLAQLTQNQKLQPGGMPTSLGDPKTSGGSSHKERENSHKKVSPPRKKFKPDLKLKCGACGQVGHKRTNRSCPLYTCLQDPSLAKNVTVAEEQQEEIQKELISEDDNLVNIDGIKLTISGKVLKRH